MSDSSVLLGVLSWVLCCVSIVLGLLLCRKLFCSYHHVDLTWNCCQESCARNWVVQMTGWELCIVLIHCSVSIRLSWLSGLHWPIGFWFSVVDVSISSVAHYPSIILVLIFLFSLITNCAYTGVEAMQMSLIFLVLWCFAQLQLAVFEAMGWKVFARGWNSFIAATCVWISFHDFCRCAIHWYMFIAFSNAPFRPLVTYPMMFDSMLPPILPASIISFLIYLWSLY